MMRSWRLRRASRSEINGLLKPHQHSPPSKPKPVYQPKDLRVVTLIADAQEEFGLVWGTRGNDVVLVKVFGTSKLHPALETGLHLVSINNEDIEDAVQAREMCEAVAPGEPLTFLFWQPPAAGTSNKASSGGVGTITIAKKKAATNENEEPLKYVTARVYKDHQDSKTGLTLKTEKRVVRLARLSYPAPAHLRPGMRLVAIETSSWFCHHTEAVALIRSLPPGYVTFLLADEAVSAAEGGDDTSVATTAPGSWTTPEDDASYLMDASRRSTGEASSETEPSSPSAEASSQERSAEEEASAEQSPAPPATPKLLTATLTPEQAQEVVLSETEDDIVYLHTPIAHLSAGLKVVSVNGETMASAGHYEHFLQTAEEEVTLTVEAPAEQEGATDASAIVTATANRPSFETKTGLVLSNGKSKGTVVVTRVTADSLFPTLQSGMQVLSINGHDWFSDYQEAIGLIRSLVGEITIVAQSVKEETV